MGKSLSNANGHYRGDGPELSELLMVVGLGGQALLLATLVLSRHAGKRWDVFEIINWMVLNVALFYFLRPLDVLAKGLPIAAHQAFGHAVAVGFVGMFATVLGYHYKEIRRLCSIRPGGMEGGASTCRAGVYLSRMSRIRLLVVYAGALALVYGVLSKPYLVALGQGIPLVEVTLARGQVGGTRSSILNSYYWFLPQYVAFIAFFCLYADLLRSGASKRWWTLFALLVPLHLASYIVGTRWGLITQLVVFVVLPLYIREGRVSWQKAVILAVPLLIIFQGYNIFRVTASLDLAVREVNLRDGVLGHLTSFDNAVMLLAALREGRLDFLWGYNYLLLPLHVIPRAFWAEKPVLSPTTLFTEAFYGTPGTYLFGRLVSAQTVTAPMEFYWQAGMAGVLLGMYLWGIIARKLRDYVKRQARHGNVFSYVIYLWFSMQTFNSMRDSFFSFVPLAVLFWAAWWFVRLTCGQRVVVGSAEAPKQSSHSVWGARGLLGTR